jgi:hypothetical protein
LLAGSRRARDVARVFTAECGVDSILLESGVDSIPSNSASIPAGAPISESAQPKARSIVATRIERFMFPPAEKQARGYIPRRHLAPKVLL